jgi:hypothetical protein
MANGRYGLAIPLAVMIIPAFDTTVAIVRRAQKGKGIMAPDREHFHHSLFDAGRSVWKVLGVFAVMYGLCAAAAIAGVWANSGLIATLVCVAVLATCVGTKTFGYHELKFLTTRLASRVASLVPTESLSTLLRSSDVLATNQLDSISEQSDEPAVISIAAGVTDAEDDSADETPDYDTGIRRAA